ncbi:TrbG/VirB9 family P-type conjugative transfer protein [Pandoraea terrigena]|uniref:P-type conjugative transfer protein VirB9 n=3 Tax=Pandoraea TaxID=93217 RepID=A0A5E4XKY6_9BURK|nr:TrbG/VirB9 family P-type conjugative transfer protein [Pandoraea terrigena]VVE14048.1 P-type conjugative transfer protein VirB9 [Pandoraea cepalis]VVE36956.1 P-type conjugative transfer protein VirB9 [Pandoraea terrigena]
MAASVTVVADPRQGFFMKNSARSIARVILTSAFLGLVALAHAKEGATRNPAETPTPSPFDDRIVTFTYSSDAVFPLLTQSGQGTHIQLERGEGVVEKPVLGDSIQWRISGGPTHLYVKPVRSGISTSLTLVTNKRTYEFYLVASDPGGKFYQQVSFNYPEEVKEVQLQAQARAESFITEKRRLDSQVLTPPLDPTSFRYGYEIKGDAHFRPIDVFDDGTKTFFRLPSVQDMPAVFVPDDHKRLQLIVTRLRGNFIIADRIADRFVLKLDDQEVYVESGRGKHWWNIGSKDNTQN